MFATRRTHNVNGYWNLLWSKDKCKLCGKCTAVCPTKAIELGVFEIRTVCNSPLNNFQTNTHHTYNGIRLKKENQFVCVGCGICEEICPNDAIIIYRNNKKGSIVGKENSDSVKSRYSILDNIKFLNPLMLSDINFDDNLNNFNIYTQLGKICRPELMIELFRNNSWIPCVRDIYPVIIDSISFGALSPNILEGLIMGIAFLNEELGMPVRICLGESGIPPRLIRSRFFKYVILQLSINSFGWDQIIHAIPLMKEDPCAIEIKYGQGGNIKTENINRLEATLRSISAFSKMPIFTSYHRGSSLYGNINELIEAISMAWGFRVPVYPKIISNSYINAILNNLYQNYYVGAIAFEGDHRNPGEIYGKSLANLGFPIVSNLRDCYLSLLKNGIENYIPLFVSVGIENSDKFASNCLALIMLGASGIFVSKYILKEVAGCLGVENDRCNICDTGLCPMGITSQDPRLYRRIDPELIAEKVVDFYLYFDSEIKKLLNSLGFLSLPVGISDHLGTTSYHVAERLSIKYVN